MTLWNTFLFPNVVLGISWGFTYGGSIWSYVSHVSQAVKLSKLKHPEFPERLHTITKLLA